MNSTRKAVILEKLAGVVDSALKLLKKPKPIKKLPPDERAKTVAYLKEQLRKGDTKVIKGIFD